VLDQGGQRPQTGEGGSSCGELAAVQVRDRLTGEAC
jgi:hypothetical protein